MPNRIFIAILVILVADFLLERFLDYINLKTWTDKLPDELKDFYNNEKYQKAQKYNRVSEKLSLISSSFSFILIIAIIIFGIFGILNQWLMHSMTHPILLALAFYGILFLVSDIINIPFSLYSTFVIEEKYGFNKTTWKTYILDKLKSYLLVVILGGGIIALLIWFIMLTKQNFWIYAWLAMMIISLVINYLYGTVIIPLFNKLKPLEEGDLRNNIQIYAAKVKFPLINIYVMDGSKRSTKANAFFTGMGKKKKIVLFDTLIEKHSIQELVAILAHEIGHYKKKHVIKNLVASAIQSFILFFILSFFIFNPNLSKALGSNTLALHINLIAFAILYEPISMIIGLLGNYISRKQEYNADKFATETTGNTDLSKALINLSTDQLSNLKPHPWYVFFHYSHPPLLKRIKAINSIINKP